jgi:hypothetical protein
MPETRVFNESVFSSFSNLKDFFNRSNAVQEVLSKKNEPYSGVPVPVGANLAGKWQVCQIATAPFRLILSICLEIFAAIFETCGQASVAKNMGNWAVHLDVGFNTYSEDTTKIFKIATSRNGPNREGKIVNEHPAIPESRLDAKARKRSFCSIFHEVRFGHYEGICRGESDWFLYLYLKTKDQFTNPRVHLAAIAEQFENGGGMDPTVLQSVFLRGGKVLNLRRGKRDAAGRLLEHYVIKHKHNDWRTNPSEMIRKIKALPVGAYRVGLPVHTTAFIKVSDQLGYYFDPNYGVIEIQGSELSEKLYAQVSSVLKYTGDSDMPIANSVDFCPYALRT